MVKEPSFQFQIIGYHYKPAEDGQGRGQAEHKVWDSGPQRADISFPLMARV
jgi:hypothetical protein